LEKDESKSDFRSLASSIAILVDISTSPRDRFESRGAPLVDTSSSHPNPEAPTANPFQRVEYTFQPSPASRAIRIRLQGRLARLQPMYTEWVDF
jgi:hypothetical protein